MIIKKIIFISILLATNIACQTSKEYLLPINIDDQYFSEKSNLDIECIDIFYQLPNENPLNGYFKVSRGWENNYVYARYKNGKYHGEIKKYLDTILTDVENYENGLKTGWQYQYFDNETTISHFEKGRKNGQEKQYIDHKLIRGSTFENGIKKGTERYYNNYGEISTSLFYNHIRYSKVPKLAKNLKLPVLQESTVDSMPSSTFQLFFNFKGNLKISAIQQKEASNHNDYFSSRAKHIIQQAFGTENSFSGSANIGEYYLADYKYGTEPSEKWLVYFVYCEKFSLNLIRIK